MALELRKAERKKSKARIGLSGPAGSGKTMSALLMAYGITGDWGKIAVIDTENGSGELYVNYNQNGITIGQYLAITLQAPYTPEKYIEAIHLCEDNGIEVAVIDSLTHAWAGEGGLLDQQGKIADSGKGNSYTAWRSITPKHNRLVETILSSKTHIIATLRSKMEYVQEKDSNGKTIVKKVGMGSIQRDGMEYEFTCFFELSQNHTAEATKDRTSLFDGQFVKLSPETGKQLRDWLETGSDNPTSAPIATAQEPASTPQPGTTSTTTGTTQHKPLSEAQVKRFYSIVASSGATEDIVKIILNDEVPNNITTSGKFDWNKASRSQYDTLCNLFEKGGWRERFQNLMDVENVAQNLDDVPA
jgi:hypothetical protein